MDPITELQTRVEWVVTATIDTVQLIATHQKPDAEKVEHCVDFVRKQIDLMTASIDAIPAWSEPETVMQERLQALKAEEDALDAELAQLLPTAEGTLVTARQHMDTVSKQAFDKHMELQRGVDEHDDKKQKK